MRARLPAFLFLLGVPILVAQAAPDRADSDAVQSQIAEAELARSQLTRSDQAKAWGLTEQEWSRFEAIKAGPRGYWSPNLDPLTALGVEARSESERRRYAQLQVRLEAERVERELAYQRAYTEAWARLYPGQLPVQGMADEPPVSSAPASERIAVFVEEDCSACEDQVRRLQTRNARFDLYLVGSQGDDGRVQAWARQAGIKPALVQRRQITLNHDRGQWFSLGALGQLPATYQQVNGQWQRLD